MKFKNILSVIALSALMMFTATSCDDYLDIDPENKVPDEEIDYTNFSNMYQPVSGMYGKLRTSGMHWAIFAQTVQRDDDVWWGKDEKGMVDIGERFIYDASYWSINEIWNQYYGMIKTANSALGILENFEKNASGDNLTKCHAYMGEVRYLRAYAYFRLVQDFGPVTILRDNNQADLTRSTVNAVYRYALEDLQYGIDNMEKKRPNEMEHKGAVTSYCAAALAAKIYLNMGDYAKVEEMTDYVINSGKFELYSDYYELFKIPGKLCNESLLESQNTDFGTGSGDYVDPDAWFSMQGPENSGSNISGWGYVAPTKEVREWAKQRGETVRYVTSFLEAGTTTPSGDSIKPQMNQTHTDCWNGKAYTPLNELTPGRTKYGMNNNIRIFRYADVLLMNAEAKVRLGKNGDAPFNQVRRRAKMPELTNVTVDQILDERRMELICEWGERYNDLCRTGKAAEVLGPKGWTKDKQYLPIPYAQLTTVPALANEPKDE